MEDRREHNAKMAADIASIKATLEGLAGPYGRITRLEEADTRQWWLTVLIAPVLALLHAGARKLGLDI